MPTKIIVHNQTTKSPELQSFKEDQVEFYNHTTDKVLVFTIVILAIFFVVYRRSQIHFEDAFVWMNVLLISYGLALIYGWGHILYQHRIKDYCGETTFLYKFLWICLGIAVGILTFCFELIVITYTDITNLSIGLIYLILGVIGSVILDKDI